MHDCHTACSFMPAATLPRKCGLPHPYPCAYNSCSLHCDHHTSTALRAGICVAAEGSSDGWHGSLIFRCQDHMLPSGRVRSEGSRPAHGKSCGASTHMLRRNIQLQCGWLSAANIQGLLQSTQPTLIVLSYHTSSVSVLLHARPMPGCLISHCHRRRHSPHAAR